MPREDYLGISNLPYNRMGTVGYTAGIEPDPTQYGLTQPAQPSLSNQAFPSMGDPSIDVPETDMSGLEEPYNNEANVLRLKMMNEEANRNLDRTGGLSGIRGWMGQGQKLGAIEGLSNEIVTAHRAQKVYKQNLNKKAQDLFKKYDEALKTNDGGFDDARVLSELMKLSYKSHTDVGTDYGIMARVEAHTKGQTAKELAAKISREKKDTNYITSLRTLAGHQVAIMNSANSSKDAKQKAGKLYNKLIEEIMSLSQSQQEVPQETTGGRRSMSQADSDAMEMRNNGVPEEEIQQFLSDTYGR